MVVVGFSEAAVAREDDERRVTRLIMELLVARSAAVREQMDSMVDLFNR